jgi:RHS repeat-associated protein
LDGPEQPAVGAPARFGSALGYRRVMVGAQTARYYTDTAQLCHDFQASAVTPPLPERGLVVAVRDPLGHQTDITPDEYGLLPVSVRDPVGLVATAEYDYRFGQVRRMVDANGHATNYRYDPMGRLAASFRTGRDGDGGSESEPEVRYSHDLLAFRRDGQPISTHATRRVHYASSGLPGEVVAAREYTDGFGRSIQKRITADEMALGATGEDSGLLMPDAAGVPRTQPGKAAGPAVGARAADRVAVSGWRVYDNKGRLVHEYEPFFGTGWAYQPETEARRGNRTTTHYDPRGQVIRIVRADGTQIRTVFGAPDDVADPDHHKPSPWVVTAYDPNDLAPISTGHDGPLTSAAPPAHHFTPTTTIRDALGRTVCQLVRAGPNPAADWHAQRTAYDVRGNPLWTVDALGRVALRHQYDLADRPLRVTSIDAGDRWSVVDAAGNAVYQADVGGHAIARTYDRANREVDVLARDRPDQPLTVRERRRYGDGGDPAQSAIDRAVARTANLLGRLSELYDGAGLITFDRYDFVGHPTHQSRQVISDAAIAAADASGGWTADWAAEGAANDLDPVGYETITAYDALERVIDIRTDAADHQSCIVPRYGRSGALAGVDVDGTPYLNLVVRDASGRRLLAAFGNGLMTRYGYDPYTRRPVRSRTERCTAAGDTWTGTGPPLLDLTYTYDLVGNITETEERTRGCGLAGPANDPDRLNRTFGYDPLYRLISATGRACSNIALPRPFEDLARCGADVPYVPGSPTPNQVNAPNLTVSYTETYRYDPVGNLLELGHTAGGATWYRRFGMAGLAPQQWQAATTNHATSVVAGKQTRQLRYDTVGNLIGENADREYVWDHAGRLIGFQKRAGAQPSISARYLYGADGARVKKWVRRGNSPSHDESTVYINRNMEHHRWKKCGGGDHVLLHVLDGPSRVATIRSGPPHPDDTGPAVRYQHDDQIGSTTLVVDATGAWMNREEYFPFGETSFGGFARKRYRFMGRERDEETGNCHHGARYYAPALCRWMSPDPAGPVDGPNLYAFVAGNPVRLADPTGTSGLELVTAAETTELVAQQAVVTTTVTTQAATSAGVDTIITLEQIAAQEAAGAQVIIGGPATTATPILAPVAVGAAGALLFLGIMGFAYVCASHSGDHVKAKMERLAAQLEQAREEREKRYAPPPPHQGPKIAPPANPFAGVVGDPPTQPEPLLAPGAEPRRHVEFPPVTIEGEMQLSKLDMETIGELQKVGSTQSYQYVIEIQLDETIHKPGQTVDPVGRFRKYYKEYGDSLVKMVVYAPTATPNARAGETERIGALGARAANIRKNTLSEIRGGAGYQGVIEIPKVGVVGVIRNRFWDQCDF